MLPLLLSLIGPQGRAGGVTEPTVEGQMDFAVETEVPRAEGREGIASGTRMSIQAPALSEALSKFLNVT